MKKKIDNKYIKTFLIVLLAVLSLGILVSIVSSGPLIESSGSSVNLSGYVKKDDVKDFVKNDVLDNYATKDFLQNNYVDHDTLRDSLIKEYISLNINDLFNVSTFINTLKNFKPLFDEIEDYEYTANNPEHLLLSPKFRFQLSPTDPFIEDFKYVDFEIYRILFVDYSEDGESSIMFGVSYSMYSDGDYFYSSSGNMIISYDFSNIIVTLGGYEFTSPTFDFPAWLLPSVVLYLN